MDFLRRLDPGRAAAAGAARLDVAPRWLERPTSALRPVSQGQDASEVAAAKRPLQAPAASVPMVDQGPPRRNRDPVRNETAGAPMAPLPTPAPEAVARPPLALPATSSPALSTPPSPAWASATQADDARLDARQSRPGTDAGRRPDAQPASAAPAAPRAVIERAMRVDALVEQSSRPVSQPTIVHVTIDRIDVRLPAADAAPSPRERRPRAASAVAPLAEYLRGGGRA